jgi:HAD superfamily hydrolase (TIGR01509 family)
MPMNRAFIFDMDGVIVDSETTWLKNESDSLEKILGKELAGKIGDTTGLSVKSVYEHAKELGFSMPYEKFQEIYDVVAFRVYDHAAITSDIEKLVEFLVSQQFKIGIVSSSPLSWINKVLSKVAFKDDITEILSINERDDMKHKPHPDGYLEMMHTLNTSPAQTIILEDSNRGINSAKASGAFTIAFTQNLVPGYKQFPADAKADTMQEVIEIIKKHFILD